MSGFVGYSGYGSDIRRGEVGVVSGRSVQVHASRPGLPDSLQASNADTGNRFGATSNSWGFKDPESRRKKRVAKYKVYAAEGKVKASFRKGIRWIKNKCSILVHGC